MVYTRVFLIVIDSVGIGGAPDAAAFGDTGSDTLRHVLETAPVNLPTLARLGLGNLYGAGLAGLPAVATAAAHHGRLTEAGAGKDTTSGHWELTGIIRTAASPTFPAGFPPEFIAEFSRRTGYAVLGNKPASGTVIIQELGAAHLAGGGLIVYTSADSVFQVAAHVEVVPLPELYRICEEARTMLTGDLAVDRVIARPFTGNPASGFTRTADRRDYSLEPPEPTILDELSARGRDVIGVGKISDIFAARGLTQSFPVHGNAAQMAQTMSLTADHSWRGLAFCNLVDFDMLYGHRNDPAGYAGALGEFDEWLGGFLTGLADDELVLITADHGNDPTTASTDHSREQVPLLITGKRIARTGGSKLKPPVGFNHVGATVCHALGVSSARPGINLLPGNLEKR